MERRLEEGGGSEVKEMLGGNKREGIEWKGVSSWKEERMKFFRERECEEDIKGPMGWKGDGLTNYQERETVSKDEMEEYREVEV